MSDFETHIRQIAEQSPRLNVGAAVKFAEARIAGNDDPLPDPNEPQALAAWAAQHANVMACLPLKPINAIKELRALGHQWGIQVGLYEAKQAIDVLRTEWTA